MTKLNARQKKELIATRLAILPASFLEVIDESDQHIGHAGHEGGGRHFAVIIESPALKAEGRIAAHRTIYGLLDDMIPNEIHALRIVLR